MTALEHIWWPMLQKEHKDYCVWWDKTSNAKYGKANLIELKSFFEYMEETHGAVLQGTYELAEIEKQAKEPIVAPEIPEGADQ
jgi:hypothetical protein